MKGPVSFLCFLMLLSASARAEDTLTQARRLYREAEGLRRDGQLREALSRYEQAYALVPTPLILLGEARVFRDLHQPAACLAALARIDQSALPGDMLREVTQLKAEVSGGQPGPARMPRLPRAPPTPGPPERQAGPARAAPVTAPPPGPPKAVIARLPAPMSAAGARAARWALGGVGLLTAAVGVVLWALDGTPACERAEGQLECPRVRDTGPTGIGFVFAGAGMLAGSTLMFGLEYSRRSWAGAGGAPGHRSLVTLSARF